MVEGELAAGDRERRLGGDRSRQGQRALDLATACDIRLCSADAFFTVQEISIGIAADLGVLQRLPKIVPQGVAREMAYTGERLGAER
ncbi:MAG TPA: enoyl-CoA hydratase-related protein, partial [Caldimonas sp.]